MIWRILVISISVGALVYVAFDTYARHKLIKTLCLELIVLITALASL